MICKAFLKQNKTNLALFKTDTYKHQKITGKF